MITHPIEKVEVNIKKKDGYYTKEEADQISLKILGLLTPIDKENKYDITISFVVDKTATEIP